MQNILLKSKAPKTVIPLIKNAFEREKKILINSIRITKEKVDILSKNFSVDINQLMAGEIEHKDTEDMQFIELEGELEILKHLEEELKALEELEICQQ